MPKAKNAKADEAFVLYRQGLKLIDIAKQLDVPEGTVRRWKHSYKWGDERSERKTNVRKRGAPFGNHNATGGPPGNKKAEKYGFFSKYLPEETKEIFEEVEQADPLDLLWHQIQIQYAAIIRAQRIAFVKDQEDKTVEITHEGSTGDTYQFQQAWDKQANFLKAQSRAMDTLNAMIRQYDKMLQDRGIYTTEEQRMRIERLRVETERLRRDGSGPDDDGVEIINDAPAG